MARIASIGALATIARNPLENEKATDPVGTVHLRMFAKLSSGLIVVDPALQSSAIGVAGTPPGTLARLEEFEALSRAGTLNGDPEYKTSGWIPRLLGALRDVEAETDAETLLQLPFELMPDAELRSAMAADQAAG